MNFEFGITVEPRDARLPLVRQVHKDKIIEVTDETHGEKLRKSPPEADGLFTKRDGVLLYVFTADCLPVIVTSKSAVGIVHSGWRSAKENIVAKLVEQFSEAPKELSVILGPSILKCCFEVKQDFLEAFVQAGHRPNDYLEKRQGKMYFDLRSFVIHTQLREIRNISFDHSRCTHCSSPELPSYRRNPSKDPRICTWVTRKNAS